MARHPLMKTQHLTLLAVSITAILVVGSIGLQYIQITAEEKTTKFTMADGISVTGIFTFRDGTEIIDIQTFNQEGGFAVQDSDAFNGSVRESPVFHIEKTPGGSPLLYQAADEAWFYGGRAIPQDYDYKYFDVDIIIARGGDVLRTFDYNRCTVSAYAIETYSDKEEAYMGKGFAVVDILEVQCDGYVPQNSELQMIEYNADMEKKKNYNSVSSLQLKQPFETWSDNFKYVNNKP